jgi:hypothetical protein
MNQAAAVMFDEDSVEETKPRLTVEEAAVVDAIKALALRWPKSLWLLSCDGELYVMRKDANGNRSPLQFDGVFDPRYVVDHIDIENRGGSW